MSTTEVILMEANFNFLTLLLNTHLVLSVWSWFPYGISAIRCGIIFCWPKPYIGSWWPEQCLEIIQFCWWTWVVRLPFTYVRFMSSQNDDFSAQFWKPCQKDELSGDCMIWVDLGLDIKDRCSGNWVDPLLFWAQLNLWSGYCENVKILRSKTQFSKGEQWTNSISWASVFNNVKTQVRKRILAKQMRRVLLG